MTNLPVVLPVKASAHAQRRWIPTVRQVLLFCLVLFSLAIAAAIMPRDNVDARKASNIPATSTPVKTGDAGGGLPSGDPLPAAGSIRPATFKASFTDNARALHCLTSAIYYEAAREPDAGQQAVAQVVLNRVRHPSYPNTICGVVFQGSERTTGCQFSYTCDGSLNRAPSKSHWARAQKVAALALDGKLATTVGTATHYHTTQIHPYWASSLRSLGTIGAHRFYSWKGKAGKPAAFNQLYAGGEPLPVPHPRKAGVTLPPPLDPIALEKAYEAGLIKSDRVAAQETGISQRSRALHAEALAADSARRHGLPVPPASEKLFADQSLPDDSRIKPEYRSSGTWKTKPAG